MINSVSNHNFSLKAEKEKQVITCDQSKRVQDSTKTLFQAFKHISLGMVKAPIALFRFAILAMRCKKAPFLEDWSWKAVKAHFHHVKILLKPKKPIAIPNLEPQENRAVEVPAAV